MGDNSCGGGVDIGLAEKTEPSLVTNRYFPSKIGGKPAWLELKNLPTFDELKCTQCGVPRIFLCQIYAPIESRDDCFHRTIFVFICPNEPCQEVNSAKNLIAFRSQLPRINDYYSAEPPNVKQKLPAISPLVRLCEVCGCHGPRLCSQCKKVSYCGVVHQKADWKYHKGYCKSGTIPSGDQPSVQVLFPELEVVIEPEASTAESSQETEEDAEKRRLQEYEELVQSGKAGNLQDQSESELSQYVTGTDNDRQFRKFKKRIQSDPDQVVRYQKAGEPLWITQGNIPKSDVPNCEQCGAQREFEFQLMPQLLNYLNRDNLDWGVIAVYTCQDSCNPKAGYVKEFIFKQDILSETAPSTETTAQI